MAAFLAPGIYVEEVEIGIKPIEGVSTSTAGFVGFTERGPLNTPTLITSFSEYRRIFGEYLAQNLGDARWLAYAVKGFFMNGGLMAYITSVGQITADLSNQKLQDTLIIGSDDNNKKRTGLQTFKDIREINIVALPGRTSPEVQNSLIAHCESMKNRIAILDPVCQSDISGLGTKTDWGSGMCGRSKLWEQISPGSRGDSAWGTMPPASLETWRGSARSKGCRISFSVRLSSTHSSLGRRHIMTITAGR